MDKPRRLRLTLGGMIILVAVAAFLIDALRPITTKIVDVKVGAGPAVKAGDVVVVHYVGKLAGGKVFDSSKARGQPFEVTVGRGRVIKGWDVGLVGMQAGGVRQLAIPSDEAYGARGVPPLIPPQAKLFFEIELLQIK
jgi:FKBP-type peptidyl-prolyl cis-trans isomerase